MSDPGHLTEKVEIRRLKVDGTNWTGAAGTTALTSEAVDLQGWDGVTFVCAFGAILTGAVTSVKARQGTAGDMSDAADLAGTKIDVADADDNKVTVLDLFRPRERYVDHVVSRGTANATVDGLFAVLYKGRRSPVTHGATVAGIKQPASPAEGTA